MHVARIRIRPSIGRRLSARVVFLTVLAHCPSFVHGQVAGAVPLHLVELARISGEDHDLSAIGRIAVSPDGRIWISQPQDGNIRSFSPAGRPLNVVGRRGEGPGEFAPPTSLHDDGRALLVLDSRQRRVVKFNREGRHLSTDRLPTVAELPPSATPLLAAPGVIVYRATRRLDSDSEPDSTIYLIADAAGRSVVQMAALPRENCSLDDPARTAGIFIPFCAQSYAAVSPSAKYVTIAWPDHGSRSQRGVILTLRDHAGGRIHQTTISLGAARIPVSVRDSVIAGVVERQRAMFPDLVKKLVSSDLVAKNWPPITQVSVSDEGTTWFVTPQGEAGTEVVCAVSRTGALVGCATLPDRALTIGWSGEDQIAIIQETEDGLHDLVLYRLST